MPLTLKYTMHAHRFRELSYYQGQCVRFRADERMADLTWRKISAVLELSFIFDNLLRVNRVVRLSDNETR